MAKKLGGLGKGLDALFQDNSVPAQGATELPIDEVFPDRNQPRKDFNEEALQELAVSVREHGVLQPILVRPIEGGYQIVAGERRWRAARIAGLTTVPVNIRELTDYEAMSVALVESPARRPESRRGSRRLPETQRIHRMDTGADR